LKILAAAPAPNIFTMYLLYFRKKSKFFRFQTVFTVVKIYFVIKNIFNNENDNVNDNDNDNDNDVCSLMNHKTIDYIERNNAAFAWLGL
jgi:hypothetical protein